MMAHDLRAIRVVAWQSPTTPSLSSHVRTAMRNLNEGSVPYFRVTREMYFGAKLEEICSEGEVAEATWKEREGALSKLAGWFKAGGDSPF